MSSASAFTALNLLLTNLTSRNQRIHARLRQPLTGAVHAKSQGLGFNAILAAMLLVILKNLDCGRDDSHKAIAASASSLLSTAASSPSRSVASRIDRSPTFGTLRLVKLSFESLNLQSSLIQFRPEFDALAIRLLQF